MKKVIKEVDKKNSIVQVTIADERWYLKATTNQLTGLPEYNGVPSVTWIAGKYPKGIQFYKWLADKGWDESQAIKEAAGVKGSKVHYALADILQGEEVRISSQYPNTQNGEMEELTVEECDAILSFVSWRNTVKPITVFSEITLFSEKQHFAGTIDHVYRLAGEDGNTLHLQDFKTSSSVWSEYQLQISAYKNLLIENLLNGNLIAQGLDLKKPINIVMDILQIGYKRNKNGYKENEIEDKFDLFKAAQLIWRNDHGDEQVTRKNYPIILSPAVKKEVIKKAVKTVK